MSVAPLDVNVLIALLDRRHVHHEAVHGWFATAQADGWATCSLTQNAVLRILGQPRHPNSPGPPAMVAPLVAELIRHPRHQFWQDSLSCELGDVVAALRQVGVGGHEEAGGVPAAGQTVEHFGLQTLGIGAKRLQHPLGGADQVELKGGDQLGANLRCVRGRDGLAHE